jgi:hypothetical protein
MEEKRRGGANLGTQIKIELDKATCHYGTEYVRDAKTFYINIGVWMAFDKDQLTSQKSILRHFDTQLKYYIKAISPSLHGDYLYSFIDSDINESLVDQKRQSGFYSVEVTVMLTKPIDRFRKDLDLARNIVGFANNVVDKMDEFPISFSKHRVTRKEKSYSEIE